MPTFVPPSLPVFPQAHYQTNHCLFSDPASDLEIVIFKLFREKEGFWKQSTGTLSLLWSCFVLWKNLQVHSYGLKNERGKSLTDAQVWLSHSCSRYICHASFIQVIDTQTYRFRLTSSCSELQKNMLLLLSPPAFAFSYPWLWDIGLFPIPLHKTLLTLACFHGKPQKTYQPPAMDIHWSLSTCMSWLRIPTRLNVPQLKAALTSQQGQLPEPLSKELLKSTC